MHSACVALKLKALLPKLLSSVNLLCYGDEEMGRCSVFQCTNEQPRVTMLLQEVCYQKVHQIEKERMNKKKTNVATASKDW